MSESQRPGWLELIVAALCGYLFLLFSNYQFPNNDQTQYMLQGLRWVDPQFCRNDWFVDHVQQWHYLFSGIVFVLKKAGCLAQGFALLAWLTASLAVLALFHLGYNLGVRRSACCLAILLLFWQFNKSLGSSTYLFNSFVPRGLATVMMIFCISYSIAGHTMLAAVFAGLTYLIHTNLGINLSITWVLFLLIADWPNWRSAFKPILALMAMVAPLFFTNTLPMIIQGLDSTGDPVTTAAAFNFIINWRSSYHYSPMSWGGEQWLPFTGILVSSLILLGKKDWRRLTVWVPIILSLCVLVLVFSLDQGGSNFFVRLYYWCLCMPVTLIALLWFCESFIFVLEFSTLLATVSLWIALASLLLVTRLGVSPISLALLAATLALFYNFKRRLSLHWLLVPVVLGLSLYLLNNDRKLLKPELHVPHSQTPFIEIGVNDNPYNRTMEWIREQTPQGAIVLAPPSAQFLPVLAERGVVATFKIAPLIKPQEILEWKRRLGRLTGVNDVASTFPAGFAAYTSMDSAFYQLAVQQILSLRDEFKAAYFFTDHTLQNIAPLKAAGFEELYRDGECVVLRFPSP